MEGKTTPGHLIKIGQDLFKKISLSNNSEGQSELKSENKDINQFLISNELFKIKIQI